MITHCRLPLGFDASRLRGDLGILAKDRWVRHFVSHNYSGDWSALPLRAIGGAEGNILTHGEGDFRDTPLLDRCPYFREVLGTFPGSLTSVRLMRLSAGSEIKEHTDPGSGYEYGEVRLHVPITTNPQVEFRLDGRCVGMAAGDCWYMNFTLPHSVVNRGATDRIHLVIDCKVDPWLDGIFKALGFSTLEKYGTRIHYLENHIAELSKVDSAPARRALASLLAEREEIAAARREREQQGYA